MAADRLYESRRSCGFRKFWMLPSKARRMLLWKVKSNSSIALRKGKCARRTQRWTRQTDGVDEVGRVVPTDGVPEETAVQIHGGVTGADQRRSGTEGHAVLRSYCTLAA
jgi:hypothetical protein